MDINPCGDVNTADMDAVLSWLDETTVSVETSMSSEGQDYLRISQPCTFEVEFINLDDGLFTASKPSVTRRPQDFASIQHGAPSIRHA